MLKDKTDVLIVGAGPAGVALAIALAQAGIDHVIVEKRTTGHNTSRAAVIHAQTLDTLEEIGVASELAGLGLKLSKFAVRDRDRALLTMNFDRLPSRHSYLLMLPQHETERVLAARLSALGGTIHRGVEATGIVQDADGASVDLLSDGTLHTVRARYVVGADGMNSVVRQVAGIGFEGQAHHESFVLADIHVDWPLGREEVSLYFSDEGLVVFVPLPDGTCPVVATMPNAPETPTRDDIQALLDARGPAGRKATVSDVVWSSRFRVHHRLAQRYRNGRLLVVGDAAHVHSPAGGQGMNTGLIDAVFLGRLLGDIVDGRRVEQAIDLYETLRRPAAEQVLSLAGNLTALATMRGPFKKAFRNMALRLLDRIAPFKRKLAMNLSGLARGKFARLPPASPLGTTGRQARKSVGGRVVPG